MTQSASRNIGNQSKYLAHNLCLQLIQQVRYRSTRRPWISPSFFHWVAQIICSSLHPHTHHATLTRHPSEQHHISYYDEVWIINYTFINLSQRDCSPTPSGLGKLGNIGRVFTRVFWNPPMAPSKCNFQCICGVSGLCHRPDERVWDYIMSYYIILD